MKCPKCNYIFSEEIKICPRCGTDVGFVLEKIGYFPVASSEPFLSVEDFKEEISETSTEEISEKKEIEFPYTPEE